MIAMKVFLNQAGLYFFIDSNETRSMWIMMSLVASLYSIKYDCNFFCFLCKIGLDGKDKDIRKLLVAHGFIGDGISSIPLEMNYE